MSHQAEGRSWEDRVSGAQDPKLWVREERAGKR